jgi:uroporphyrin-III C-methyltransferase/precorrin-2 dehydrogenase/sirohydrochlorin ferrochelatase
MIALPHQTRPARLDAIPRLPVFLELQDKRALVTGGGPGSAWKAELLAASGADVHVHAAEPGPDLLALAAAEPRVRIRPEPWTEAELAASAIAIGGEPGPEAERLALAARRLRVPVNVIDTGPLCDFTFGSIVNRSPVLVAISTDGAAPVLAQAIRRRIEAVLPVGLGRWAAAAQAARGWIKERLPDRQARRRFWDALAEAAFARIGPADPAPTIERLASAKAPGGEIVLVGAGPGGADLLTLAAVRELQAADVIFYDRLVSPDVLELGRREARRVSVGKQGRGPSVPQEEIERLLVEAAQAGERVVRLKGGDPALFARTAEEVAAARAHAIPVRIVPGVTAASAAAAAAGLALTDRRSGRRLRVLSGHDGDTTALAEPETTTAIYMGRDRLPALARAALQQGARPDTPAIIATAIGSPDERIDATTIGALAHAVPPAGASKPAVVLWGAGLEAQLTPARAADDRLRPGTAA